MNPAYRGREFSVNPGGRGAMVARRLEVGGFLRNAQSRAFDDAVREAEAVGKERGARALAEVSGLMDANGNPIFADNIPRPEAGSVGEVRNAAFYETVRRGNYDIATGAIRLASAKAEQDIESGDPQLRNAAVQEFVSKTKPILETIGDSENQARLQVEIDTAAGLLSVRQGAVKARAARFIAHQADTAALIDATDNANIYGIADTMDLIGAARLTAGESQDRQNRITTRENAWLNALGNRFGEFGKDYGGSFSEFDKAISGYLSPLAENEGRLMKLRSAAIAGWAEGKIDTAAAAYINHRRNVGKADGETRLAMQDELVKELAPAIDAAGIKSGDIIYNYNNAINRQDDAIRAAQDAKEAEAAQAKEQTIDDARSKVRSALDNAARGNIIGGTENFLMIPKIDDMPADIKRGAIAAFFVGGGGEGAGNWQNKYIAKGKIAVSDNGGIVGNRQAQLRAVFNALPRQVAGIEVDRDNVAKAIQTNAEAILAIDGSDARLRAGYEELPDGAADESSWKDAEFAAGVVGVLQNREEGQYTNGEREKLLSAAKYSDSVARQVERIMPQDPYYVGGNLVRLESGIKADSDIFNRYYDQQKGAYSGHSIAERAARATAFALADMRVNAPNKKYGDSFDRSKYKNESDAIAGLAADYLKANDLFIFDDDGAMLGGRLFPLAKMSQDDELSLVAKGKLPANAFVVGEGEANDGDRAKIMAAIGSGELAVFYFGKRGTNRVYYLADRSGLRPYQIGGKNVKIAVDDSDLPNAE